MEAKVSKIAVNLSLGAGCFSLLDGSIHDHALAHAGLDQSL